MGSALRLLPTRGGSRALLFLLALAGLIVALAVGVLRGTRASPEPLGIHGSWHLVLDSEFDSKQLPAGWKTGWLATG